MAEVPGNGVAGRVRRGIRARIVPIGWTVTVVALIVSVAFSFLTITSTNKTLDDNRSALATAQAVASGAQARVAGLTGCVAAMKADEAALASLNAQVMASRARTLATGDIGVAREAYEAALRTAVTDFRDGSLALDGAAISGDATAFNAAVLVLQKATTEMHQAATLKAALDSLISDYEATAQSTNATAATIATQMAATTTQCNVAVGS